MIKLKTLVVVLLFVLLFIPDLKNKLKVIPVKIPLDSSSRQMISGLLYGSEKSNKTGFRYPAVILLSGVIVRQSRMLELAGRLSRAGFLVLTLDYSSSWLTESERIKEVEGAIKWLEKLPEVSPGKIGIVGHSMGANVAYGASMGKKNVNTIVSLGMAIFAPPNVPPNILQMAGLYDQAHTSYEMQQALVESIGDTNVNHGITYGDFTLGTARRLIISPFSSHATELTDPVIINETVAWLNNALRKDITPTLFAGSASISDWSSWIWRPLKFFLCMTFLFLLFIWHPELRLLILGTVTLLGIIFSIWKPVEAPAILVTFLIAAFLGSTWGSHKKWRSKLAGAGMYVMAAITAYLVSLIITHLPHFMQNRQLIFSLPVFLLFEPLQLGYLALGGTGDLFGKWITFVFAGLMILEGILPGKTIAFLQSIATALCRPFLYFIFPRKLPEGGKVSSCSFKELLLLFVTIVIGIIFWRHILNQYSFDIDLFLKLARFVFGYILFPFLIFCGIVRFFKRFSNHY